MKEILFATDFSERSDRALRRAILIAKVTGARLTLLHVIDDDRPRRIVDGERDSAEQLLNEQAHTLATVDGVTSRAQIMMAAPAAGLAKASENSAYDLLILGQHRRQLIRDAFVGTTAERTIRQVKVPVLMVSGPPVGTYRHVLVATDLSHGSRDAAEKSTRLGLGAGAQTTLLHVFLAPALRLTMGHTLSAGARNDILYDERKNALRGLSSFAQSLSLNRPELAVRHEDTTTAQEILTAADESGADLIVVASQSKGGVERFLLGSVTEKVLAESSVDVLVIPPAPAGGSEDVLPDV